MIAASCAWPVAHLSSETALRWRWRFDLGPGELEPAIWARSLAFVWSVALRSPWRFVDDEPAPRFPIMSTNCIDPKRSKTHGTDTCGTCAPCARTAIRRAAEALSAVYEQPVGLRVEQERRVAQRLNEDDELEEYEWIRGRLVVTPPDLPKRPPPRPPSPAMCGADARALVELAASDDPVALLRVRREHEAERLQALLDELRGMAVARGLGAEPSRQRLRIKLTHRGPLTVRLKPLTFTVASVTRAVSGAEAMRAAVAAELALDGRLSPSAEQHPFLRAMLAGEAPAFPDPWQAGLANRMGLQETAAPAAWLREELARYVEHGPTPGGLGSPVAVGGVTYAGGRLLAIDGVPICHVDVEALGRWRLWARKRAERRRHPVVACSRSLGWLPVTWGPPGDPGCTLPFARDGPESARIIFDRHRRMYAREALPPVDKKRPPTDWGRAGTPLPLQPPRRSRGRVRELYDQIARHWLVGWSLAEIANAADVSRSSVDRAIRSARAASEAARKAFNGRGACTYAGPWLAVNDGHVVVTERWEGRHG